MSDMNSRHLDPNSLRVVINEEMRRFKECYTWLEETMPASFLNEVPRQLLGVAAYCLMGFHLQEYFTQVNLKNVALVICLDGPDADVRILSRFRHIGVKGYRAYISPSAPPIEGANGPIRIGVIYFTEAVETVEQPLSAENVVQLRALVRERLPDISDSEVDRLLGGMNTRFLRALPLDRLAIALDMFSRAKTRDYCQYEIRRCESWEQTGEPSLQVMLAWKNTPKQDFLYLLARVVLRHNLVMQRINATYVDPFTKNRILMMGLGLHGAQGQAAWEAADLAEFLREMVTLKYFLGCTQIDRTFVNSGLVRGNLGSLLKAFVYFIHQVLVQVDEYLYALESVEEALCRHPELTVRLCEAFEERFRPDRPDPKRCRAILDELTTQIECLDTGQESNDERRKNVLWQGINFVQHMLKTNFYRNNKSALSFRLDPDYLDHVPFNRHEKFPELPFAVFFITGMHYIAYHIRFRDLSRGGLRTIVPKRSEDMLVELNHVFTECYNLALTQQKKNKDIPEGGAKGVIFIKSYGQLDGEAHILRREQRLGGVSEEEIDSQVARFVSEEKEEFLYETQRSYVNSLLTLVNCEDDGTLKAKHVIDYYRRAEYIYLGPDENMSSHMIEWIARHAQLSQYKPKISFITSKPRSGINHKEWGITSLGVNVYMTELLKYLGLDPSKDPFTVKISGGPDGDVAGNQILNIRKYYAKTAKLLALTDVSGTIYDARGLNLDELEKLFRAEKPISFYPPHCLSEGGFLLDRRVQKDASAYAQLTLLWRKQGGQVIEDWLGASEANRLYHRNLHSVKADVFVPCGGRPRTLNEENYEEFLDEEGKPTSRAIVEGANLYLSEEARRLFQKRGVLIIKDSSANKCGVIGSSYEVLCGLALSEEEMIQHKSQMVGEIMEILRAVSLDEAYLLLDSHANTGAYLTDISDWVSERINTYSDQLLLHLEPMTLSNDPKDPLVRCFIEHAPPLLATQYLDRLMERVPDTHKKATIASQIASRLVYHRGLTWSPSIVDILPLVLEDRASRGHTF